ncbi:hypothetical protein ABZZ79_16135 [Streptomyces sp. NPDC006458]|uniref:hypothetical protein n=1 Tax=Streptomyces sp. NPDC006458 TaxID=3154302 RepID=UPI0033BAE70D
MARPEDTVMVDDLEQNIAAAERAGLAGVLPTSAAATEKALKAVLGPRPSRKAERAPGS